jgi:hypothetical protein
MRFIEDFTGIPVSSLTNSRKLIMGCCIMVLAPLMSLSNMM